MEKKEPLKEDDGTSNSNILHRVKDKLSLRKKKQQHQQTKDVRLNKDLDKKEKENGNFFQRLFKLFICGGGSKKDKDKANGIDCRQKAEGQETVEGKDVEEKDQEVISILNQPKVPAAERPPLPPQINRRTPCSASISNARPISQLDEALKQFKLSTAASRENLKHSRLDISHMEDTVRNMVASRPGTPSTTLRYSAKLSSSLGELRRANYITDY